MVQIHVLRHRPVQKRSRSRVEDILRAAEQIFNERGYEEATTNAIAEKANIPIGSLYQYFKNKKAILDTLSDNYTSGIRDIFEKKLMKELQTKNFYELSDVLLDDFAQFYATHTAFQVVLYGASRTSDLDDASDELRQNIIMYIEKALLKMKPDYNPSQIHMISTILVAMARSLFPACITTSGKINQVILDELKKVVKAYMKASFEL